MNFALTPKELKSEEVVVTGHGRQSQRKISSSISSITSKEIIGVPVTGLDQTMQGRIFGVKVTQNSGESEGSVSVRIRGAGYQFYKRTIFSSAEKRKMITYYFIAIGLKLKNS
jgi:outer membrane receptor for ferrienterochelin and colicin